MDVYISQNNYLSHSDFYMPTWKDDIYLMHHGVKGMKWGVRRYQNPDGTWKKKARIGSAERVRQKQAMFRSKINADGILGSGDVSTLRRNTINDRRRGRIASLEQKARNREARDEFIRNPNAKNLANFAKTGATRAATNGVFKVNNQIRGKYHRLREDEKRSIPRAALESVATNHNSTTAALGMLAENLSGTGRKYQRSSSNKKRRR